MNNLTELKINNGNIKGAAENGMYAFKGIPFAKPPTGQLRFMPPVPCDNWSGVLDCTHYGPRPCQVPPPGSIDSNTVVYDEDCLNLNVWTPNADKGKRPVAVNFYGGGHTEGSNSESGSEGYNLTHGRDMVVVAPNYRLGALGYLYLRHLLGEQYAASGSLGLLDQILALTWVKNNIAFFGGDPDQVTIIGQSAGGKSVGALLAAPGAKNLFHRAIAMSGALQAIKDIQTKTALTKNFLSAMNLDEKNIRTLLSCPVKDILEAQERANETFIKIESYGPTADGIVAPLDITKYIASGGLPKIAILLGHTQQELFFPPDTSIPQDAGLEAVEKQLYWKFGDNMAPVLEYYKKARAVMDYAEAYGTTITEYTYIQACKRSAEQFVLQGLPLWLYRWDYTGGYIAGHSSDNEALFGRSNPIKIKNDPGTTCFIDSIFQDAVLNFIEKGRPSSPNLPEWKSCTQNGLYRMIFDKDPRLEPFEEFDYDRAFPLQAFRLGK